MPRRAELQSIVDYSGTTFPMVDVAFNGASCGSTCTDITDAVPERNRLTYDGRSVRFGAFPISIDAKAVDALARDPELRQVAREQFLGRGAIQVRQVFERAVARGEIPEGRNLLVPFEGS